MCASPFWEAAGLVSSGQPFHIRIHILFLQKSWEEGGVGSNSILGRSPILFEGRPFNFITRAPKLSTLSTVLFLERREAALQQVLQPAVKLWEQRGVYIPLTVQSACYAHCWDLTRDPELYRSSRKRPLKSALEYIHRCVQRWDKVKMRQIWQLRKISIPFERRLILNPEAVLCARGGLSD